MSGENEFLDEIVTPVSDFNDEAPVDETLDEYGPLGDDDPPGVPAPPDLEDQNGEEGDDDA